jgi:AcrR family transcriptional regulator
MVPGEVMAGRRARHRADVRARLIDSALAAFTEVGFDAVTAQEVADRAGVSRRSFFRYFPTKEAVVLARRQEQLETFRALLGRSGMGARPFDRVRAAFEALAEDYTDRRRRILAEHALFLSAPALVARDLEIDRGFEREIAAALTPPAGDDDQARRARLCAGAIVGVLRVVIEEWVADRGRGDLAARGREALALLEPLAP